MSTALAPPPYHVTSNATTLEYRGWYEHQRVTRGRCFRSWEIEKPCVLKTCNGHDAVRLDPGSSIRCVELIAKVDGHWIKVGESADVCSPDRVLKTLAVGQQFRIVALD